MFASLVFAVAVVGSTEPVMVPPAPQFLEAGVGSADIYISKSMAHGVIHDYQSSAEVAGEGIELYPDNIKLRCIQLEALGQLTDERALLAAWDSVQKQFGEKIPPEILEEVSWALIRQGNRNSASPLKLYSLLGAALTRDIRAVPLIEKGLASKHAEMRAMSVRYSGMMRDREQQKVLVELFKKENHWGVRRELIRAFAQMHSDEARPILEGLIGDDRTESMERLEAIGAMIGLIDDCGIDQVAPLLDSKKAGLRLLGVHLSAIFGVDEAFEKIAVLAKDPIPEVRIGALIALDLLSNETNREKVMEVANEATKGMDPKTAITACWVIARGDSKQISRLVEHLRSSRDEVQIFAAMALAKVGPSSVKAMRENLEHSNPMVRLNLALGLIPYGERGEGAAKVALAVLEDGTIKIAPYGFWVFSGVASSPLISVEESEKVKLQLLTKVALIDSKLATDSIRKFLAQRTESIKQVAAISLIEEGDIGEYQAIKNLIHDDNPKVRLQAAYLLAMWAEDREALDVLVGEYPNASREMKERIIEGIGAIAGGVGVEFLEKRLCDPFPSIRILAATALLQTLNQ